MLYMVEMELIDASLTDEFNAWYEQHVEKLLGLPGFIKSQRFKLDDVNRQSYLAIHSLQSGATLTTPEYRSSAGPNSVGIWTSRITGWRRNLFVGLDIMPHVGEGACLVMSDIAMPNSAALPGSHGYELDNVGLDHTSSKRFFVVVTGELARSAGISIFMPISHRP